MAHSSRPIPKTISAEARAVYEAAPESLDYAAVDKATIGDIRKTVRAEFEPAAQLVLERTGVRLEETDINGVPVMAVHPKETERRSVRHAVLYFYGGGHITGSPFEDLPISATLASKLGVTVFAPHYRLAPEHPYPAAHEDGLASYRGLLEQYEPSRLAVVGESAGGNLATSMLLAIRDAGEAMPQATALLSPWVDLADLSDSRTVLDGLDPALGCVTPAALAYANGRDLQDPGISPVYADFAPGFPPTLITTGTRDYLSGDCARLSTSMRLAGVDVTLHLWEGMWHVFEFYPDVPEARQSLAEIATFLAKHLELGQGPFWTE